ncbi:MAG: S9 family peptidase, partial [Vulcanimicrobiaceae bacterium]
MLLFALSGAGAKALPQTAGASADPFLWLEDKDGARAIAWVRKQNARTVTVFERDPHYARFYGDALSVLRDKRRIPFPSQRNGSIYNFWQDASHAQGIWRRTTVRSYASAAPHWTTVVDLDAISKREHVRWVWHDASCEPRREQRCLLYLSNGGEDAATVREFDLKSDRFVTDGFVLPRGKQRISWVDADTLLVAREWSPGAVTTSGYPYIVKRLRRGQRLEDAVEIFRGFRADVSVDPVRYIDSAGNSATIVDRNLTFFTSKHYLMTPRGLQLLNLPAKSDLQGLFDGKLLVILRQPWMAQS